MPLEIGYWSIRGLGAPLRAMAMYADEPFEAKCYDVKEKEEGGWRVEQQPSLQLLS